MSTTTRINNWWYYVEQFRTRITPSAQTSDTPSLKSVKQSTQAWNSVAYCFLCPYPEYFMNVHPYGITWCCQQTRTQKIGVEPIIPKMFQIFPCVISWKFHENPLIDLTMVLRTNTPGVPRWDTVKQSRQVWNSLVDYFLYHAWLFLKNSWKSVHPFFHNIANKHGSRKYINRSRIQGVNRSMPKIFQVASCVMSVFSWKFHENPFNRFSAMLLRGMDCSENGGKNPVFKGLYRTSWKCSQLFLVSRPTNPENFMKILSAVFRNVANRQTDRQTKQRTTMKITFVIAEVTKPDSKLRCFLPWKS